MEDLFLMEKITFVLFCISFFGLGMVAGMLVVLEADFTYKGASILTCEYANALTDIANKQSELLKTYTETNYVILDQLNCERLK